MMRTAHWTRGNRQSGCDWREAMGISAVSSRVRVEPRILKTLKQGKYYSLEMVLNLLAWFQESLKGG